MSDKLTAWQYIKQFCTSFVSLRWLDGSINFVFRFVAKISELLLAIGIVISAADFLTHGRLMQNNVGLADAWAWTQAIAIESSAGVVLLYALQAHKDNDIVKCILYAILAAMLALVGGVMLYTQIIYSTAGIDLAQQAPLWFAVSLAIARTFVSIAYVAMCRIKHVRLSGNEPTLQPTIDIHAEIQIAVGAAMHDIQNTLQTMQEQQFEIAIQRMTRTVIEEVTQAHLVAIPKQQNGAALPAPMASKNERSALQALHTNPAISNVELAKLLQVKDARTAKAWRQKQEA